MTSYADNIETSPPPWGTATCAPVATFVSSWKGPRSDVLRRLDRDLAAPAEAQVSNLHLAWRVVLHLARCVHWQKENGEGRGQPPRRPAISSDELTPNAKWTARRAKERQCSARK